MRHNGRMHRAAKVKEAPGCVGDLVIADRREPALARTFLCAWRWSHLLRKHFLLPQFGLCAAMWPATSSPALPGHKQIDLIGERGARPGAESRTIIDVHANAIACLVFESLKAIPVPVANVEPELLAQSPDRWARQSRAQS